MTTVSAGEGPLGRLVSFIRSDHRYVLLGTSAIAAAGMACPPPPEPRCAARRPRRLAWSSSRGGR